MRDIIQTQRLILRPLTLSDAKNISLYGSDFEIARMTGSFPHPFPLLSAEFKVMDLNAKRRRTLAYPYAITKDGGALIGITDLFRSNLDTPLKTGLEIGYWIGRPFWDKGFVTEACRGIIAEAKETLQVTQIKASVFADNPASVSVIKKLGFTPCDGDATGFSMARLARAPLLHFCLNGKRLAHADPLANSSLRA